MAQVWDTGRTSCQWHYISMLRLSTIVWIKICIFLFNLETLYGHRLWCPRQIWGMDKPIVNFLIRIESIFVKLKKTIKKNGGINSVTKPK